VIAVVALVAIGAAFAASLTTPATRPVRPRTGPTWARGPVRARIHAARRTRPSTERTQPFPSWDHTDMQGVHT
jgi:hypothetical protein